METEQPVVLVFQIGGFTTDDQTPSFDIEIPYLLSFLATGSFQGEVQGRTRFSPVRAAIRSGGELHPTRARRRTGACGSWLISARSSSSCSPSPHSSTRRGTLATKRWFLWAGVYLIPLPYLAALAGWVLTEVGRQPWIVWGLAEDGGCQLAERLHDDDRLQPRKIHPPVRRPGGRRRHTHAPLCAARPAGRRRRRRRVRGAGGEQLMDLQLLWFCLIAFFWAGYFALEGFDLGVGMHLPFLRA